MDRLHSLQSLISEFGAETYPLFLRLGAVRALELQPVTARALLGEVERFQPLLGGRRIPGLSFLDARGQEIGGIYGGPDSAEIAATDEASLAVTADGIRVVLRQLPPPVGFRSSPALETGWYECYFESIQFGPPGPTGRRTPDMGGSGAPVALPDLPPLPPLTRWHFARTANTAQIAAIVFTETPAEAVFRDLLHALTAACTESLRLRRPLRLARD
ncbi:MAG: hypothetical protein ACOY93_17660 [Bacillota bacterium]